MAAAELFHVEVSAGFRRARVFNVSEADLVENLIQPWREDQRVTMGEREWVPRESELRILRGPRMENVDLSFGQGWANAERASVDVTRELIESAPAATRPEAFLIETEDPEAVLAQVVGFRGRPLSWEQARGRIEGRDPEVAAVILVVRQPAAQPPKSSEVPRGSTSTG
ncbi:MAG: hypothetical protein U0R71_13325 [Solirubrobacterales bacterium]